MNLTVFPLIFFSYFLTKISYKNKLSGLFNIKIPDLDKLYNEINNSQLMVDILSKTGIKKGFFDFSMASVLRAPTLYVLCRILKPETVVETGVADGFSSAFILKALEVNGKGHLYSIDLPNQAGQELKEGRTAGWLIPEELKTRWTLMLGSSKEKLPGLLVALNKKVDMFCHDSDHSYENMMFEFNTVLPYMDRNSLVVADDITDNHAFGDFCKITGHPNLGLFKLGIIRIKAQA